MIIGATPTSIRPCCVHYVCRRRNSAFATVAIEHASTFPGAAISVQLRRFASFIYLLRATACLIGVDSLAYYSAVLFDLSTPSCRSACVRYPSLCTFCVYPTPGLLSVVNSFVRFFLLLHTRMFLVSNSSLRFFHLSHDCIFAFDIPIRY